MQILEQFKTGWLSELLSFFVGEPCQDEIRKRGKGDLSYENRSKNSGRFSVKFMSIQSRELSHALPYLSPPILL